MLLVSGAASLSLGSVARTTVECPSSIDATGATDVTAALTEWLSGLKPGTRATFAGKYRVDQTVNLTTTGLLIDGGVFFTNDPTGDGSTLAAPSSAARTRAFLNLHGCTDVGVANVTFTGPNTLAGTGESAYVAALEAQHFVNIVGSSSNIWVRGCTASMIYGDFVYVGGGSSYVVVSGNDFHNNGRQGTSVCDGSNVWVVGNTYDQIRRTVFDLEPATDSWHVDHVVIQGNKVGSHRLNFVSAASSAGTVDDVWVVGNQINSAAQCSVGNPRNPGRDQRWVFSGNASTGGYGSPLGYCIGFTNVDGLTAHGNAIALQTGRSMYVFAVTGCTGVDISGNQFPGGVGEVKP